MTKTHLFVLAVLVAVGGLALVLIGALRGEANVWIAGIGVLTSVGGWVGLKRPSDMTSETSVGEPVNNA